MPKQLSVVLIGCVSKYEQLIATSNNCVLQYCMNG